jgi:hypothetical protein
MMAYSLKLPLAALILGLAGWFVFPEHLGWFSATIDIYRGRYEILTLGLPPAWYEDYSQVMLERYGVTVRPIAGCVVTVSQEQYARSYNHVSVTAIHRKYGRDVVDETRREAASAWAFTRAWQ